MMPHEAKLLGIDEGHIGGPSAYTPFTFTHGASYGSKGSPSGGGYVPGDREAAKAARQWAQSVLKGTKATPKRRKEWEEYARRQRLTQDQVNAGWAHLTRMGEATSWWGYSVPHPGMVKMPQRNQMQNSPAPGFPFHTRTAEIVFKKALELIPLHPEKKSAEILKLAIEKSQSPVTELTPEDGRLLDIAISWAQNGKAGVGNNNRMAGTPGGPFRSTTHSVAGRGAP
jgi:hypothetical protein